MVSFYSLYPRTCCVKDVYIVTRFFSPTSLLWWTAKLKTRIKNRVALLFLKLIFQEKVSKWKSQRALLHSFPSSRESARSPSESMQLRSGGVPSHPDRESGILQPNTILPHKYHCKHRLGLEMCRLLHLIPMYSRFQLSCSHHCHQHSSNILQNSLKVFLRNAV